MGDAGFFRGTSAEQDNRFTDKQKKLLKTLKFADNLSQKVDMKKINLDVLKPWITNRVNNILGLEDDVVIEYIFSQLEEKDMDPRLMQINLTGFLNAKRAREFMSELWQLLLDAQTTPDGIPPQLIELKKEELKKRMGEQQSNKDKLTNIEAEIQRGITEIKAERDARMRDAEPRRDRSPRRQRSRSRDRFRDVRRPPPGRDFIPRRERSRSPYRPMPPSPRRRRRSPPPRSPPPRSPPPRPRSRDRSLSPPAGSDKEDKDAKPKESNRPMPPSPRRRRRSPQRSPPPRPRSRDRSLSPPPAGSDKEDKETKPKESKKPDMEEKSKKRKKKEKKHKSKDKKHKKHKKRRKRDATSSEEETDSSEDEDEPSPKLDKTAAEKKRDLEKVLREKALQSMKKQR